MKLNYLHRFTFLTATFYLACNALVCQPANDDCINSIPLSNLNNFCSAPGAYTSIGATSSINPAQACWGGTIGNDVWFSFVATATDVNVVINGNIGGNGTLNRPKAAIVWGSCTGTLNEAGGCAVAPVGQNTVTVYKSPLVIGQTYYIRVSGVNTNTGTFQICINNFTPQPSPGADCGSKNYLCNKNPVTVTTVTGAGNDNREAAGTCMDASPPNPIEGNTAWYYWVAGSSGTLTFTISPTNPTDDIDWVLFELPNGNCTGRQWLRCCAAGNIGGLPSPCLGPTGLSMSETDLSEPINCPPPNNNFVRYLDMIQGRTYALLIENFSSANNGFSLSFGGTGTFLGPTAQFTATDTTICAGQNVTFTNSSLNATGYTWSFTGGNPAASNTTGPHSITYPTPGTYTVNLSVVAQGGCPDSRQMIVVVSPYPVITSNSATICTGINTTLTASGGSAYTWMPGNSSSNPYVVNPGATTTYTVTGQNAGGCTNSALSVVTVNPGAVITATGASICPGQSTTISASGATTYTWQPIGSTSNPVTVNPMVTTTYTVTGSSSGCSGSTTVVVTVNANATVISIPATICNGQSAVLTASGADNYTWSPGGSTSNPVTVNPTTSTTYSLTGATLSGCSGSTTVVVTVNPVPVVNANPLLLCKDSSGALVATGCGNYTWFPGGTVSPSISVTPNVTGITTYTVSCSTNGCSNSTTVTLTANDCSKPTVVLTGGTICQGFCYTLSAQATGSPPLSYSWLPNQGSGSTIQVCPLATTTYSVIVSDYKGDTDTAWATVTVNPPPVITANNASVCIGVSATLTANGGSPGNYTWIPSCGGNPVTGSPVTVSPNTTCSYTVVGMDANGCINAAITTVTVNPLPVVTSSNDAICQGETGTVTASGANSYVWQPTGQTGATMNDTPSQTTTYTVTGTSLNGCTGTVTAVINVENNPVVTCSPVSVCAGQQGTLTASGAVSYTWLPKNTIGTSFSDSPSVTTTYTITGITTAGCTGSTFVSILVNPVPVVAFEPDTSGCTPLSITFANNSTGVINSTCVWDFGNGRTYNGCVPPAQTYSAPGIYSVTLTVTSNNCTASLTRPNIIRVYPLPVAGFTASPWETEIMEPTIRFTNNSSGDSIRNWTFGDGGTDSVPNPVYTYKDTGHYTVCLMVQNSFGCTDAICQTVIINPVWSFYIPNAFTPNGDGRNDTFNGKGENILDYQLYIYDRWGNFIFESNSLQRDWDGKANGGGDIAQEDVYVYVVIFKDIFDKKHKMVGSVTLVK